VSKSVSRKTRALFETWYEQDMPRLYNFVVYQVQDEAAAEEIIAAVCEKALRRLHQFDAQRGVMAQWMFGIARNAIRDYMRGFKRSPGLVPLDALPDIQARGYSVEHQVQLAEDFAQTVRYIALLPERDQEIIAMRFGAEMSNQEIADALDLTANHVGVLLYRALNKLRDAMQQVEEH